MPTFKSIGSAAAKALKDHLLQIEVQRRTQMLDGLTVASKLQEQSRYESQARRQAEQDRIAAEDRARQVSAEGNAAGVRDMFASAMTGGQFTPENADTLNAMSYREGVPLPAGSAAKLTAPKIEPPKRHIIETIDPATGRKVKRAVTEDELSAGIPVGGDDDEDIKEVGGYIYTKRGGKWTQTGVTRDKPSGDAGPKPPTQGQLTADTFYGRASAASKVLNETEGQLATYANTPSWMNSAVGQQYGQAQKQWIEAYLRKDSGAAIGKDEYANAAETYFPQVNDDPKTVARKRAARREVEETLKLQGSGKTSDSAPRSRYKVSVR